jgi:hypothetical protein
MSEEQPKEEQTFDKPVKKLMVVFAALIGAILLVWVFGVKGSDTPYIEDTRQVR